MGSVFVFCIEKSCRPGFASERAAPSRVRSTEKDNDRTSATTALPMVIAIAAIEVRTERMQSDIAAALVGAGLLSVLLFPAIASALLSRIDRSSSTSQRGNEREEISSPETPTVKGFYPVMIYNLLAEIPLRRRIWADSAERRYPFFS
jgi:hypothetical protein